MGGQGVSGELLSQIIVQLGQHIGVAIAFQLVNNRFIEDVKSPKYVSSHAPNYGSSNENSSSVGHAKSQTLDLSNVNLVVKSDVKEPPMFCGDGTDKCNVYE